MIRTAKFGGRCSVCDKEVRVGDRIDWRPGGDGVSHAACTEEGKAVVAACAASRATEAPADVAMPVSAGLSYLPYQRAGIAYAASRRGTLIADEMGLGKTVQAIGVVNATVPETVCVVCPASLKLNWVRECERWLCESPDVPWCVAVASGKVPAQGPRQVLIINYDILGKLPEDYRADLLVLDEAHYIKNSRAQRTRAVLDLAARCGRVVALTGTPVLNKPVELWPILQAVAPAEWDPAGEVRGERVEPGRGAGFFRFARRYCDAHQERVSRSRTVWVFDGHSNLDELQERLRSTCMVRRLKADVLGDLPPKRRQVLELPCEQRWDEPEAGDDYESARERLPGFTEFSAARHEQALVKVPAVVDHVRALLESTEKVVVFAHHHDVVDALRAGLAGAGCVALDGRMSAEEKQASVDAFQGGGARVFVGSLKAAGVGLTLTAASTVVFAELDWTPATLTQAEDRCHRIGQRGHVLVQHLVLRGTLDAHMVRLVTEKQAVADMALDEAADYETAGRPEVEAPRDRRARLVREAGLTEERVAEIHEGLRFLAARCDGANERDGAGFNKLDANFGRALATQERLSPAQAIAAAKVLVKYGRQLGECAPAVGVPAEAAVAPAAGA